MPRWCECYRDIEWIRNMFLLPVPFRFRLYPRTLHRCSRLVTATVIFNPFPDTMTSTFTCTCVSKMDYNFQAKFRYNENYVAWKYRPYFRVLYNLFTTQMKYLYNFVTHTSEKIFNQNFTLLSWIDLIIT